MSDNNRFLQLAQDIKDGKPMPSSEEIIKSAYERATPSFDQKVFEHNLKSSEQIKRESITVKQNNFKSNDIFSYSSVVILVIGVVSLLYFFFKAKRS